MGKLRGRAIRMLEVIALIAGLLLWTIIKFVIIEPLMTSNSW